MKAAQVAQNIQSGTKTASESFNRFVEGESGPTSSKTSRTVEPERKDFWDSFAAAAEERSNAASSKPSAIGTTAMKKGGYGATGGVKKKESWEDENWEKF